VSNCSSPKRGTFDPTGFRHDKGAYTVRALDGQTGDLMPASWQIDNYYESSSRYGINERKLLPKKGADYESTLFVDVDGDGENEDLGTVLTFDLRFAHRNNDGIVWLRTVPIPHKLRDKDLRVLARSYMESIAGTNYEVVQFEGRLYQTTQERTYATSMLQSANGRLAGQEAYSVTFDITNVDQFQVSKNKTERRVRLVLVRAPFQVEYKRKDMPVLMIAGYANLAEDFDASQGDFDGFLQRISFRGNAGAQFETPQISENVAEATTAPTAATPSAAPAEPAVPAADGGATSPVTPPAASQN
jgi:hypothetical protein